MDEKIKKEINLAIDKAVAQIIKHFRPIIAMQGKKINNLRQQIFDTDRKLKGIKYKIIYKTKKGFVCPVCGKDMESEIYEEALRGKDTTLKKLKKE